MLEKEEQGKETSIQGLQNDLLRHEVTKKKTIVLLSIVMEVMNYENITSNQSN